MIPDLESIESLEDDLENDKTKFLESKGWKYSCSNPASLWLWEKKIRGRWYRGVSKEIALMFERVGYLPKRKPRRKIRTVTPKVITGKHYSDKVLPKLSRDGSHEEPFTENDHDGF